MRIASLIKALLFAVCLAAPVALLGCGDTSSAGHDGPNPGPDIHEEEDTQTPIEKGPGEVESEWGTYHLKFTPTADPIPFNDYFELDVAVYHDAEMSELAEDVALEFDARTSLFRGHLPTQPVVEKVAGGRFRVRGILLHVPRPWTLEFEISEDGVREKANAEVDPTQGFETGEDPSGFFTDDEVRHILNMSPEGGPALPESPSNAVADDPAAAHLGQFLFFEKRLSANGEVSCASCHAPQKGFADAKRLADGIGQTGRHAPTLLNAAFNRWQFWDGRSDTLWSQAWGPLEADVEHGTDRLAIAHLIATTPEYKQAYEAIFGPLPDLSDAQRFPAHGRPIPGEPARPEHLAWTAMSVEDQESVMTVVANITKSIAAYERKLISLDADFDRFAQALREQDADAIDVLSESARRGLKLYLGEANCVLCHNGALQTNFEFHNLGMGPRAWLGNDDDGRFTGATSVFSDPLNATGAYSSASDWDSPQLTYLRQGEFLQQGAFKTPTLRNITQTAPYMHGGEFETLSEVINFYADLQEDPPVGRRDTLVQPFSVGGSDVADLEAFLETLNGAPLPEALLSQPDSPIYAP